MGTAELLGKYRLNGEPPDMNLKHEQKHDIHRYRWNMDMDWGIGNYRSGLPHPDANHGAGRFTVPTKLGRKNGVDVGIHIPAQWSIWERVANFPTLGSFARTDWDLI